MTDLTTLEWVILWYTVSFAFLAGIYVGMSL